MKFTILATILAVASAACSNSCSGHGTCGAEDTCQCNRRWTGPDCAQRECPKGLSWVLPSQEEYEAGVGPAKGKLGGLHLYTECSSKGTCATDSGMCTCFEGFTGVACSRQKCPNDCSGHGRCVTNADIISESEYLADFYDGAKRMNLGIEIDASSDPDEPSELNGNIFATQIWDKDMSRKCLCDRGWTGYACGSRICPTGADPLVCETKTWQPTVQYLTLKDVKVKSTPKKVKAIFSLTFTDMFNGVYTTSPIRVYGTHFQCNFDDDGSNNPVCVPTSFEQTPDEQYKTITNSGTDYQMFLFDTTTNPAKGIYEAGDCSATADDIKNDGSACDRAAPHDATNIRSALQALPNFAIPSVNVTIHHVSDEDNYHYAITFSDDANAGEQKLMSCTIASDITENAAYSPRMEPVAKKVPDITECEVGRIDPCTPGGPYYDSDKCNYVLPTDTVYKKSSVCSNRGTCDGSTGLCTCFEGYAGEACSIQTIFF